MRVHFFLLAGAALSAWAGLGMALAQQGTPAAGAPQAIAYAPTEGVTLSGSLSVANGRASIGNNSAVTAGAASAVVTLARGGSLRVCASTSVHLSRDAAPGGSPGGVDDAGLMLAIDRGALEAKYAAGKYSDVLLTPDLRILISGPGQADVKLRVSQQGDTCVDNHGYNAPYITVSSLMDGGVYRVQPNQRVLFEHGSLQQVVDREAESCGCPDAQDAPGAEPVVAGVGGPSSTAADTAFPTAVSEGLAAPPAGPTTPVAAAGQAHAQVTASISNEGPLGPPPSGTSVQTAPAPAPAAQSRPSLLRRIGHAFSRLFGRS